LVIAPLAFLLAALIAALIASLLASLLVASVRALAFVALTALAGASPVGLAGHHRAHRQDSTDNKYQRTLHPQGNIFHVESPELGN
jgi:hypothetical protein